MALTMVEIPEQKLYDGNRFPAVISPTPTPAAAATPGLTETIQANKQYIQDQLRKSGAVFFRGFPVNTASDFNDAVEAFGYEENPYVGTAPRTKIVGRVFTANEAPPDVKIPFHHEMALYPEYPSKLLFFCEVEPVSGGETPIVLSHIVYERMQNKHPQFVQKLEDHGLIYTKIIGQDDDPSSAIGRGWKTTFATEDKNMVEQRVSKEGFRLEWLEDGGVKTIKGPILGIKCDSSTGQRKTWFNSIVIAYTEWKGDARNDPEKVVTFGDGSPLAADIIYDCQKILEVESVAIPWRKGDVLLLDNLAVLHSRNPCATPRRVLAALCKAAKLGYVLEWLDDGVKTIRGPIPGIKCDSSTRQRKVWFNNNMAVYLGWKDDARNSDPEKALTFGDGSPLAADVVYDCQKILEDESVAIPWRKGDVLLLDNMAVLHSRNPCTTPRRVLASLCK